jgi:hypothetical protein
MTTYGATRMMPRSRGEDARCAAWPEATRTETRMSSARSQSGRWRCRPATFRTASCMKKASLALETSLQTWRGCRRRARLDVVVGRSGAVLGGGVGVAAEDEVTCGLESERQGAREWLRTRMTASSLRRTRLRRALEMIENVEDDCKPACELELVHGERVTGEDRGNSSVTENL